MSFGVHHFGSGRVVPSRRYSKNGQVSSSVSVVVSNSSPCTVGTWVSPPIGMVVCTAGCFLFLRFIFLVRVSTPSLPIPVPCNTWLSITRPVLYLNFIH